jgi:hypothetical protein
MNGKIARSGGWKGNVAGKISTGQNFSSACHDAKCGLKENNGTSRTDRFVE